MKTTTQRLLIVLIVIITFAGCASSELRRGDIVEGKYGRPLEQFPTQGLFVEVDRTGTFEIVQFPSRTSKPLGSFIGKGYYVVQSQSGRFVLAKATPTSAVSTPIPAVAPAPSPSQVADQKLAKAQTLIGEARRDLR